MGEGTVLQASRLTKSFRAQRIIEHLSLKIPEGSLYGFLGPNGAGKTDNDADVGRPDSAG